MMDKPRRVCPACGFVYFTDPKVGVGVLVVQGEEVLLVRGLMNPERGKWSLPAGFLDHGEDPQETAAREVWEETHLRVAIDGLVDVYYNPPAGAGGASVFILYYGHVVDGELQAGDDADAAAFFHLNALPELAFRSTQEAIARWQTRVPPP